MSFLIRRLFAISICFCLIFVLNQAVAPENMRFSRSIQDSKWWKEHKPIKAKSRFSYHKRPPNLLTPGVLHFKSPDSKQYYFHDEGARIIKASHFMKRYHLGRKISFVCVARGNPRPQITWLKDGLELSHDQVGITEWRKGKGRLKSKAEIDPATPKDAGYYECQSDNKYAIDRRGFFAKYELN